MAATLLRASVQAIAGQVTSHEEMASSDAAIMIAAAAVVVGGVTVFKRNKASRLVHAKSEMQGEDGNKENSRPETWRCARFMDAPPLAPH